MVTFIDPGTPGTGGLPRMSGLVGALLHAAASGLAGREGGRAATRPVAPGLWGLRRLANLGGVGQRLGQRLGWTPPVGPGPDGRSLLAGADLDRVDAEAVARLVVDHYPGTGYPAVVLGSPHGSAAHLAVALGAPWLPAAFDVSVAAPTSSGGAAGGWMRGAAAAARILSTNPQATVRHVDRAGAAGTATLFVRWRQLPEAYARFLAARLSPGATVLLVRDSGSWASGHCAQAINPEFAESLRLWTIDHDHPLYRVTFSRPEVFSAAVADLYRRWLRAAGKTGSRLVVECARQLDPWQVLRAGLVPYWLAGPSRYALDELQWWLAGSRPYTQIDVLVDPPGAPRDELSGGALASVVDFASAAAFARLRGSVDERAARAYPDGDVPPWRATEVLRRHPYDLPVPPRLAVRDAVWMLGETTEVSAMIVH